MSTLFIRADVSSNIGIGHVMRCLALAQAWQERGGKALFLSCCESDILRQRIKSEGMDFIPLERHHPDPLDLERTVQAFSKLSARNSEKRNWIVADGYHFDATYQKQLKEAGASLLCIDDYGHAGHYYADIVLNQNISADGALYSHREPYTQLLLGTRYTLLRREFRNYRNRERKIPEISRNVLVTMGGADAGNATLKIVRALKELDIKDIEAKIILGPANPNRETIKEELSLGPSSFHLLPAADNMPGLMAWADIAVAAGGSTCWEMVFMGLPMAILILAENQKIIAEHLASEGVALNLPWHQEITAHGIAKALKKLMTDRDTRKEMCSKSQVLVDGEGSLRVVKSMSLDGLVLRPIREQDCEQIWKWANDPFARKASFSSSYISWDDHLRWFRSKLQDPFCLFFLVTDSHQTPVGQVRIEKKEAESRISVSVDGRFRGYGCGSRMIELASHEFFRVSDDKSLHAYVKIENDISKQVFLNTGFKDQGLTTISGCSAIHLELQKNSE